MIKTKVPPVVSDLAQNQAEKKEDHLKK